MPQTLNECGAIAQAGRLPLFSDASGEGWRPPARMRNQAGLVAQALPARGASSVGRLRPLVARRAGDGQKFPGTFKLCPIS